MSHCQGHYEIGLFIQPLDLLTAWVSDAEPLVLAGAAALIGTTVVWLARRWGGSDAQLRLWPVPLALGLVFLWAYLAGHTASRWRPYKLILACWALPPMTVALSWFARARARHLSMAGWLLLPTATLTLVTLAVWEQLPFTVYPRVSIENVVTIRAGYWSVTRLLAAGLVLVGTVTSASAFAPSAHRLGHSRDLASRGALLICVAGVYECHRALLDAWFFNDLQAASVVWALREQLLLCAAIIAGLSLFLAWRDRRPAQRETRRQRRAATALSALQLTLLALCFVLLEVSAARGLDTPGLMRAEPECPRPPCTVCGSHWSSPAQALYPVFRTDMGVIEVGFAKHNP